MPNIPSLNIKPHNKKIPNGIDTIFYAYSTSMIETKNTQYLVNDKIKINQELFLNILKILSEDETTYYTDLYNNRRHIKWSMESDAFKIDKYNYEENIIHNLVWTNHYYFDKCKDYEWFYCHHHGPFISDIYNYIKKFPNRLNAYEELYNTPGIWFEYQIKPLHQLMLVLPLESSYLLPTSYRNLMFSFKLKKYFPDKITDIDMDYLYKNKCWQNIPMIDIIPAHKIINLIDEENERNKLFHPFIKNI